MLKAMPDKISNRFPLAVSSWERASRSLRKPAISHPQPRHCMNAATTTNTYTYTGMGIHNAERKKAGISASRNNQKLMRRVFRSPEMLSIRVTSKPMAAKKNQPLYWKCR